MILCGEDLSDAMSITKISKYVILPLAYAKISILAISMYQSDYILVIFSNFKIIFQSRYVLKSILNLKKIQEKDYDDVIECLSNHIPRIFDQSFDSDKSLVFQNKKGQKIFSNKKYFQKTEDSLKVKKNKMTEREKSKTN